MDRTLATRRDWVGLAVLTLPALFLSMDLSVLYLAVPKISEDLRPSSAQLLWLVDVYGFLLAGSLVTMGTLGDRIGRRRLLLTGAGAFAVASLLAAYSTSAEMLIATRALLGVAGATLAPSTLSLVRGMFTDPRQRTRAISVWVTALSAGGAVGPVLGGVLLQWFWWGSVFLLGVPVMVLLLALGPVLLPEYRDPSPGRLDVPSVALSFATVLPIVYGVKLVAQAGPGPLPALAGLVGLAAGTVFVRRQRVLEHPLVDLRLFRVPAFSLALTVNTVGFLLVLGMSLLTAQYLQLVLGLSPLAAGLWEVPFFAAFVLGSTLAPALLRRLPPVILLAGGLAVAAAGFALLTGVDATAGLAVLVTGSVVFSLGLAPVFTLVTDLVVGAAPPERTASAASVSETGTELGGALGIALLGSVGTAVYRARIGDGLPAGTPGGAADAARDTLGGAVAAAGQLPSELATALLVPAQEAFTSGLQVAALLSALVAAGLAVLVVVLLRSPGTPPLADDDRAGEREDDGPGGRRPEGRAGGRQPGRQPGRRPGGRAGGRRPGAGGDGRSVAPIRVDFASHVQRIRTGLRLPGQVCDPVTAGTTSSTGRRESSGCLVR